MRYQQIAISVAYRICGDPATAEDVAQLTFIRIWEKLGTYRPDGSFRGWLCRIAANLTVDTLRKQKPTADIDDLALADPGQGPERATVQQERAAAVRAALMRLPTHTRAALVLREYEGFSYHEIADALNVPLGTVKSRINDARRRLQEDLRDLI
ncbi:MAG: sigma-70 family RNA polymerase sigma factor [Anaerolineae bacterium]|nr:sigma-70 family RNA polymerase sigma factor [Anaerolineae bacterium]